MAAPSRFVPGRSNAGQGERQRAPGVRQRARQRPRPQENALANDPGTSLDAVTRSRFESLWGQDFGQVRIHAGERARRACERLGADAFTHGEHVFMPPNHLRPDSEFGAELLGHELVHVLQQRAAGSGPRPLLDRNSDATEAQAVHASKRLTGNHGDATRTAPLLRPSAPEAVPYIQRRLRVTGVAADIEEMILLLEPAVGLDLEFDAAAGEIVAMASMVAGATSPSAEAVITRILNDPAQDAELQVGQAQTITPPGAAAPSGVMLGAFPVPDDLTAGIVQTIDIDDVRMLEAGAPGHGVAILAHEIQENYHAHSLVPTAGVSRFAESHAAAVATESDVAEDLVGPGRRSAFVIAPAPGGNQFRIDDFENYYRVREVAAGAGGSVDIVGAQIAARLPVGTYTIEAFATGSDVVPATAAATASITAAAADLAANATATVRIDGFTDNVGAAGTNLDLSRRRAESARASILAAGAAGGAVRFHTVGQGATAFVEANDTGPHRARNRRVLITIERPDI